MLEMATIPDEIGQRKEAKATLQNQIKELKKYNKSHNLRHFNALIRKNAINWRRTLCGSLMEIICPIILMSLLVWARTQVTPDYVGQIDLHKLQKAFYPVTNLNNSNNWTSTNFDSTKQGLDLVPFMTHSNYSVMFNLSNQSIYSPMIDPLGPFYFYPPHCYARTNRFGSPIIAYIPQGNQIEQDVIQQLQLIFDKQKTLLNMTAEFLQAFSGPLTVDSLRVIMKLLDGGTTTEQLQILLQLDLVPKEVVNSLKFINQLNSTDPLLPPTQKILEGLRINSTNSSALSNTIDQTLNTTSQFIQMTTLVEAGRVIGLTSNQTSQLLILANSTGFSEILPQQTLQSFGEQVGMNQTQNQKLQAIMAQLDNQQNATQKQAQSLKQLIVGNISQAEFENNTQQNVSQMAKSIGLNETLIQEIEAIVISNEQSREQRTQLELLTSFLVSLGVDSSFIQNATTLLENLNPNNDISNITPNSSDIAEALKALNINETYVDQIQQTVDLIQKNVSQQRANQTNSTNQTALNQTKLLQSITNQAQMQVLGEFRLVKFNSNQELDEYIMNDQYGKDDHQGVCFGFKIIENAKNDYELELMFNDLWPVRYRGLPSQKRSSADPTIMYPQPDQYGYYVNNGFSQMQNWVANTILKRSTGVKNAQITTMIVPIQIPPVWKDNFAMILQQTLTLFMLLMYIPIVYRTVYRIVFEKVTRAKESMRIMGMTDFPYWASWFVTYSTINTLLVLGAWGILNINVFSRQSSFLLFVFIWVYGQSLFGLILIAQSLFSTPRAAAISTTVVYFGLSIISLAIRDEEIPRSTKYATCWFFPTVAMIQTVYTFVQLDTSGLGITSVTWTLEYQNFSVKDGIILMCISGANMMLLGIYLEAVLPKTYGQKKHPCFFICCPWRCKRSSRSISNVTSLDATGGLFLDKNIDNIFETKYLKADYFEAATREIKIKEYQNDILKISDLKKKYDNGFKAVKGINLKMYTDQIFVLLGHNGAGKTTTISMLTGLLSATEGAAEVFGVDIFNRMYDVRKFMGVCPQHDILFELLTTEEHLSFFYDLKGANPDPKVKKIEIEKLMVDFGIIDKRYSLASQLSGGNKRKLSVAIALCGNSRFVLLDEPTSGMDLQSRRQLWNMLKQYKKNRIILLTTHYMDEADILGDRIGIMSHGKMTCLGTSVFLKNKFGVGYNFTAVKTDCERNEQVVKYMIENLGPKIKLQSECQTELTIQIPQDYSGQLSEFFERLDDSLAPLGLVSYGVSISTLEEVFLKVGELEEVSDEQPKDAAETVQNEENAQNDHSHADVSINQMAIQRTNADSTISQIQRTSILFGSTIHNGTEQTDFNLKDNSSELEVSFFNCLVAVLLKRIHSYKRNRRAIFNEVVLPAFIIIVGFTASFQTKTWRSPSRIQSPDRLPQPQSLLINSATVSNVNRSIIYSLTDNLPDAQKAFKISYYNKSSNSEQYGQAVYDYGSINAEMPPFMYGSYQIYEANIQQQQFKFLSFVNLTSQDATGLYPQFMYESILKVSSGDPNFKFKLRSTPYPPTKDVLTRQQQFDSTLIVFVISIGFSVLITTIVSYLVVERAEGLKHLQLISGMQLKAYWMGNFIIDFLKVQLTIGITIACFFGYDMNIDVAYITYLVFPFGILPFTYVTSFLFTSESAAQTFTMVLHFFIIAIMSVVTFALRLTPAQQLVGDVLNFVLKVIPTYPLASSIFCDTSCSSLADIRAKSFNGTGGKLSADVWHISNNLSDILVMVVHLVFWVIFLILIENGNCSLCKFRKKRLDSVQVEQQFDDDVLKEAQRIQTNSQENKQELIEVQNFGKLYQIQQKCICKNGSLSAVENLSFSLNNGECFALLGVNGAGKSTTFKGLTCQVKPTTGKIMVGGFDVNKQFKQARRLVGYCPQPNLIFDTMSVEEHLYYYARIKGIPASRREKLVYQTIEQLGLQEYRRKTAGTLSGGNKRKVCVGIALVGNPPIILLDEPSAGMDPEARRFMWQVIAKIANNKTSAIVLTTHSMDEAEALSTKMGIMAKGGIFKCFGSAQHIKNKFSTGYLIELKIATIEESKLWENVYKYFKSDGSLDFNHQTVFESRILAEIEQRTKGLEVIEMYREIHNLTSLYNSIDRFCEVFTEVELLEQYGNYMKIRVQKLDQSIGKIFGLLEQLKVELDVCNYAVSQTTLEQIFQSVADKNYQEKVQRFRRQVTSDDESNQYKLVIVDQSN